ncbi:MAG: zinc-ribbon domain-containing protein [Bacteroidales bacterium]|nr:zinc-ribbon domain-containing protein [Bacteroidales bacterium]
MSEYIYCKDDWKTAARNIFLCVIGVVVLTPVTVFLASFASFGVIIESIGGGETVVSSGYATAAAILSVALLGLLVYYIISLSKFKNNQISGEAASSVNTIRTCVIIQFAGVLLFLLSFVTPVVGGGLFILWCIVLIVMLFIIREAYRNLSEEETWSKVARRGASQLRISVAYTIYSIFAPVLWVILFGLVAFMVSGVKGVNTITIITDLIKGDISAYLVPFLVLVIGGLFQLYWCVMSFVLMLMGWNNIQSGSMVDVREGDASEGGMSAIPSGHTSVAVGLKNEVTPSFCSECGMKLNPGSRFCPSCGKPLVASCGAGVHDNVESDKDEVEAETDTAESGIASIGSVPASSVVSIPVDLDNDGYAACVEYTETDSLRKKWLYGGICAGIVILGGVLWYALAGRDKVDGPVSFVFAQGATMFGTMDNGGFSDPVCELEYGDSVVVYGADSTGNWLKAAVRKNGSSFRGYVDDANLMDRETFNILKVRGGIENDDVRHAISEIYERRALARKLVELGPAWKLHVLNYRYGHTPMVRSCHIDGLSPASEGFAFIAINNDTGEKHFYLYSHDEDLNPVFIYDEPVKKRYDGISDISIRRNKVKVKYYMYDMRNDREHADDADIVVLKGLVDDQYPVTMKLKIDNRVVTGSYHYDKYGTSISLNGELEIYPAGDRYLNLTEMSGGVVTGQFIGSWEDDVYSGSWVSDDGEKEMPFRLTENS